MISLPSNNFTVDSSFIIPMFNSCLNIDFMKYGLSNLSVVKLQTCLPNNFHNTQAYADKNVC